MFSLGVQIQCLLGNVFMAASFVERHSLERQIDISGVKGKSVSVGGGQVQVHLTDPFDVFKKVKGTPKYWQLG